jgi:hypothetical protein
MRNDEARGICSNATPPSDVVVGAPVRTGPQLARILAGSRWAYRRAPFAHIYVENVFVAPVYNQLSRAFRELATRTAHDQAANSRLSYFGGNFDGYLMPFRPALGGPLSFFVCKAWVNLLASATGVKTTCDVNGALHHHTKGAKNGFVHKDFSSCWFIDNPRPDGINVTDNSLCNYRTGETSVPGVSARERVRAVAMIFYLNNAPWSEGDGGETGLYVAANDPVDRPAARIPPLNNSMLLFECSPHSYHSFISNRRNPRSSVAIWLHRTREDAVAKWGGESIVYVRN